jgi:transcriptional regulator with XRE-family HTH domain
MPDIETWWAYVEKHAGKVHQKVIADKAGVDGSTVSRWKEGVTPKGEAVVAFARAYKRSPIEALIAARYIEPDEVGGAIEISISMGEVSDAALLEELAGRLAAFRRLSAGHDSQHWPPPAWDPKNSRVSGRQNSGQRH